MKGFNRGMAFEKEVKGFTKTLLSQDSLKARE